MRREHPRLLDRLRAPRSQPPGLHGRYVIGDEIAAGGMATVHLGRMIGDAGFARTVAIKRLHPQFAKDPEVCAMLLDEGRLSARIHHLNVVTTLDVVASGDELFVVMDDYPDKATSTRRSCPVECSSGWHWQGRS